MKSFQFLCLICCLFFINEVKTQEVKEEFEKNEIVPDVIDTSPKELVVVSFPNSSVKLGNELTPTEVKQQPEIQWKASSDTYYTFTMVDPDAWSRENATLRNFLHWLVVNVPGSDISKGEIKTHFMPSLPPKGSGLHRYVFLVYEQNGKQIFDEPEIPAEGIDARMSFSVKDFEKKHGLSSPKAGNFYQAQWDESVTKKT